MFFLRIWGWGLIYVIHKKETVHSTMIVCKGIFVFIIFATDITFICNFKVFCIFFNRNTWFLKVLEYFLFGTCRNILIFYWYRKWNIWVRVFKNGPSKISGRHPLKNLKGYGLPQQTISLQIFKGRLPQILLGPFLNTLSHTIFLQQLFYDILLFSLDA